MKAKLGYLCSSESWGGLEMNHLRNASWMHCRGYSIVILCVENTPLWKNSIDMKLPVLAIKKHQKYYDFKNAKRLAKIVLEEGITHLIVRSTRDMSILAAVKRKMGRSVHTSYFMEMQLGVKKTNLLHTIRYKYIDVWSCPLNWLKEQVENLTHFKNSLVVIPSGIDLGKFSSSLSKKEARETLQLPEDRILFGLIGRFDLQKGQLLLLEAMAKCSNHNFSIVFLGEPTLHEGNESYQKMEEFITLHRLNERVFIRPFREDTSTFYHAIDWLVMATKAETFGMVTIESLACGTPVIGSNAGGTPEILQNETGGLLFSSMNAEDLASKIDLICQGSINYDQKKLRSMALPYDHNKVCSQVEQVLGLKSLD